MSRVNALETREARLAETIKRLEREVAALKSNQPSTVILSTDATGAFSVAAKATRVITSTLTPLQDQILLAIPEVSVYKGTSLTDAITANLWDRDDVAGYGSNFTADEANDIEVSVFIDRHFTDSKNLKCRIQVKNKNVSSSFNFFIIVRWRGFRSS